MRFVVDLFRYILLAMCALAIIAAALLIFAVVDQSSPLGAQITTMIVLIALASLALLVINLGGVAIYFLYTIGTSK